MDFRSICPQGYKYVLGCTLIHFIYHINFAIDVNTYNLNFFYYLLRGFICFLKGLTENEVFFLNGVNIFKDFDNTTLAIDLYFTCYLID